MKAKFRKRIITLKEFFSTLPRYIYTRFIKLQSGQEIDAQLSEKIKLEISQLNECKLCYYSHSIIAEYLGVEKSDLEKLDNLDEDAFHSKEWQALNFARLYLYQLNGIDPPEDMEAVLKALKREFHNSQIETIKDIVFIMNFNNRTGNTLEMFISRLSGRVEPARESSFFSELVITLFFSLFAIPRTIQVLLLKLMTKLRRK